MRRRDGGGCLGGWWHHDGGRGGGRVPIRRHDRVGGSGGGGAGRGAAQRLGGGAGLGVLPAPDGEGGVALGVLLGHSLDPEHLGDPEEGGEVVLGHGDLAPVHVVQQRPHLAHPHVLHRDDVTHVNTERVSYLEKHDGMLARVVHEEVLEVVARRGEYDLVTLEAASVTGESDVGEGLGVEEPLEHGEHVGLVLGPPQAELVGQRVQP